MILVLSNKLDITTDVVIHQLKKRGLPFFRWNADNLLASHSIAFELGENGITQLVLQAEGRTVDVMREISVVWYRRPSKVVAHPQITRESMVEFSVREGTALLQNIWQLLSDRMWINVPSANIQFSNKLYQLCFAREIGFKVPATIVTTDKSMVKRFASTHDKVIVKALSAGYIREGGREKLLYTQLLDEKLLANLEGLEYCPTQFQEYIPKKLELRITVVGDKIHTCAIGSQESTRTMVDWRRYDFDNVPHYAYDLPREIKSLLLEFMRKSRLVFGAFDLIVTPGDDYYFLEVNPNGQWYWIERLTGLPITESLVDQLEMAMKGGD